MGAVAAALTCLCVASTVAGEPAPDDGVYGRFDGDLDVGLGLGAELEPGRVRGAARLSAHYFYSIGAYASYRNAFCGEPAARQLVSAGVDLRPVFIPRWVANLQQGPRLLDLFVDSISLGIGASWQRPTGGAFGERHGLEASLGFGLPLFATAQGLWLETRGMIRWLEGAGNDDRETAPSLLLTLSWHELVLTPLAPDPES